MIAFTRAKCGLVNPERPCRCRRRLRAALRVGRVAPGRLTFAADAERAQKFPAVLGEIRRLEEVRRAAALFRSHASPPAPDETIAFIRRLTGTDRPAG